MIALAQEIASIDAWTRGDKRAMRQLMSSYETLINARAYAAHKRNRDVALDNFTQAAWVGFVIACKKCDPSRGARVSMLAEFYIKTEIEALLLSKRVTSASNSQQLRALFNRLPRECRARGYSLAALSDVQAAELAAYFSCSKQNVYAVADFIRAQATDLNAHDMPAVKEEQLEKGAESKTRTHIESALAMLPERERLIVELNVIREPKVTLEKIGVMVCLTKERVRQLRDVGLGRMRAYFDERGIEFSDPFAECGW